jgi:hypothetical protein
MIRYAITPHDLRSRIDAQLPGTSRRKSWLQKAVDANAALAAQPGYSEVPGAPSWSDVKPIFRELQHNKCAYCERDLPTETYAGGEHDVEHYRPKGACNPWPPATWPPGTDGEPRAFDFDIHTGRQGGYRALAYDPDNYAVSCGTCNQALKHDAFPIQKDVASTGWDIGALNKLEKPFLPFPVGGWDVDPETLITFEGILAIPANANPRTIAHRRALVTIEFFQLNVRGELLKARARLIRAMASHFEVLANGTPQGKAAAREELDRLRAPDSPHAACARAFAKLWAADPAKAYLLARDAKV